jgi:TPR repeat protein
VSERRRLRPTSPASWSAQTTIEAWKRDEVPPVENDGILTAEDVSTLDLQGTWLVTLSACDTGSGEARAGEGVMGLRRGFIQAGAQNLLMTLWPISDEVTVQIMSDFYEAAHNSGNAPEALAEVQRNWLLKLRTEKGLAQAVNLAGPFIMSSQGSLMAEPSGSPSSPLAAGAPSPTPLEWHAGARHYLDSKDFAKALALLQKAAADGQAAAMDNLGLLYRDGKGVTQDYGKALLWFQNAANAGDTDAMNNLGLLYYYARGVVQNYGKARYWYQKSADADDKTGMYNLGVMYREGQGVPQDYGKAREWYQKAADAGLDVAQQALKALRPPSVGESSVPRPTAAPRDHRTQPLWSAERVDECIQCIMTDASALCPWNVRIIWPLSRFHSRKVPSSEANTTRRPSGVSATAVTSTVSSVSVRRIGRFRGPTHAASGPPSPTRRGAQRALPRPSNP